MSNRINEPLWRNLNGKFDVPSHEDGSDRDVIVTDDCLLEESQESQ